MNFALSLNDKYVMPCLALSTSIFENNRKNDCRIYLLTDGLKEENISKFDRLANIYKQQIIIKKVPKELYDNLPFIKRYTFATYNRFMIADLIEDSKVIYLDGDIIVRHDLSDLWNTPIDGYASGVVEDQRGDDIFIHNLNKIATPY
ncbi:MAG: glycosyltransferase family 8 protein, partial [Prevotella sp.]|nr:glycosyltransferase family 8 protein [Prevotella sp.]